MSPSEPVPAGSVAWARSITGPARSLIRWKASCVVALATASAYAIAANRLGRAISLVSSAVGANTAQYRTLAARGKTLRRCPADRPAGPGARRLSLAEQQLPRHQRGLDLHGHAHLRHALDPLLEGDRHFGDAQAALDRAVVHLDLERV